MIKIKDNFFVLDNKPFFVVGTNYFPLDRKPFWRKENKEEVVKDFDVMKAHKHNTIRVFIKPAVFFNQEFNEPIEEEFNGLNDFLDIALKKEIYVMVSLNLFYLHNKTPFGLPPIPTKGNPLKDRKLIKVQERIVKEFCSRYKNHEALFAWDIQNEPSFERWRCFGGKRGDFLEFVKWVKRKYGSIEELNKKWGTNLKHFDNILNSLSHGIENRFVSLIRYDHSTFLCEMVNKWLKFIVKTIRMYDNNHLITIGITREPILADDYMLSAFDPRRTSNMLDFVCVHAYGQWVKGDAPLSLTTIEITPFLVRYAHIGKPVLLQEVGYSFHNVNEEECAKWLEKTIKNAINCGLAGFLYWSLYIHNWPLKEYCDGMIGLLSYNKKPFKVINTTKKLARLRPEVPIISNVAIVNSYCCRWTLYEVASWTLFQTWALLRSVKTTPEIIDIDWAEIKELIKYKLLIVPNLFCSTNEIWNKLIKYVENGGTLYLSGFPLANPYFEKIDLDCSFLGVKVKGYEIVNKPISILVKSLGNLRDEKFTFNVPAVVEYTESLRRIKVRIIDAEINAVDNEMRYAIVTHKYKKGKVVFVTHPIETYLAWMRNINYKKYNKIYDALLDIAEL
jgi:endo-1,4-beta-mannosidase